ncbi:MAG: methyl-accepting chemotaxis protein [Reichenbachiella sp.]
MIQKNRTVLLGIILYVILGISGYNTPAQQLRFDRINTKDGLSQDNVTFIYEDFRGFIWIGTEDGLNLYDGYEVKTFFSDSDDSTSLPNTKIYGLAEDKDNNLWIGTNGGLSKYDRDLDAFKNYSTNSDQNNPIPSNGVTEMFRDSKGELWVGFDNGFGRWISDNEGIETYLEGEGNDLTSLNIRGITEDQDGNIWVAARGGINKIDPSSKSVMQFRPGQHQAISSVNPEGIFCDSNNNLWIGYYDAGLTRFNLNSEKITHFRHNPNEARSIPNDFVHHINENSKGEIWVSTDVGLCLLKDDDTFITYVNDPNNPNSLSNNVVLGAWFDTNEHMWVATRPGGVCTYDENKYAFQLYTVTPNDPNGLSSNNVSGFAKDNNGLLYIATDGAGINAFDQEQGTFKHLVHDPNNSNSPSNNKVLAMEVDRKGNLWFGMWAGGVNRYNPRTGIYTRYWHDESDPNSLSDNNVFDILEDQAGNIWIATWGRGVSKYIPEIDGFKNYVHDPNDTNSLLQGGTNCLMEDAKGNIWVGSDIKGVSMLNVTNDTFTFHQGTGKEGDLPDVGITEFHTDTNGRIWMGTAGAGLAWLDEDGKFQFVTKKDGLPNNVVLTIQESNDGELWLGTNKGLCRYNPQNNTFNSYFAIDGLQGNQFQPRVSLKLNNGDLAFAGTGGFNIFNPSNIVSNVVEPPIYITDMNLFNQKLEVREHGILQNDIGTTKKISLNYDQNIFSFEYIGINYRHTMRNKYKYKMVGLHDDWVMAGNERKAAFMNLDPGAYTFMITAANNDGVWNSTPVSIDIDIVPAFWNTWWFRLLVLLFMIGTATWLYKRRMRETKEQKKRLERKVQEATEKVTHQNDELQAQSARLRDAIEETNFVVQDAVESGNFKARLETENKTGAWKELGDSVNLLFATVERPFKEINNVVNHMAQGDLTQRYTDEAKGDIEILANNLNSAMGNLSDLLKEMRDKTTEIGTSTSEMLFTTEEMNGSTGEIASAIEEMSRGAQDQVSQIDESSNLIENIMNSSDDMGSQADSINSTAKMGVKKSVNGLSLVQKVDESMKNVMQSSEKTNASITSLTNRANDISGVLRIIKEIASQTNLLALNAAIEAAQAGDAGRGFSVVAEEIRKLAEDSKKSAGDIETLIMGVQKETFSTARLVNEMGESIKESEMASSNSMAAFEEISKDYGETLKMSEQIVTATKQQNKDVKNVLNIISGVVVIAEETAAGSEETASSATELSSGMENYTQKSQEVLEIVKSLQDKVDQFKL